MQSEFPKPAENKKGDVPQLAEGRTVALIHKEEKGQSRDKKAM